MSRSKPKTQKETIAKRYFKYNGKTGSLFYYDKEKQQNVEIEYPFSFMVLDELQTVKGWHDEHESAIWANEVRNVSIEPLVLRTSKGRLGEGFYSKDIKGNYPVDYYRSIYIAYYEDNELVIGNVAFKKSANTAWGQFANENPIYKGAVVMGKPQEEKNKAITYFVPTFKFKESISPESEAAAIELDKKLQEYLTQYFKQDAEELDIFEEELELEEPKNPGKRIAQVEDDEIPF